MLPKVAALTTIIPNPVLGGAMIPMFGMVISSGVKMLSRVNFQRNENLLIVSVSVGIGLGASVVPGAFAISLVESVYYLRTESSLEACQPLRLTCF